MLFICYKFNLQIAVFFIQEGKTALFHAIDHYSECEDDEVKDVLRYLVKLGADLSATDKVSQNSCSSLVLHSSICRTNKMHCIWPQREA